MAKELSVLATFPVTESDTVTTALNDHFSRCWTSTDSSSASDLVKGVLDGLGGIREGQLLFTSNPDRLPMLFGAWWPWGNGETVSLRIGFDVGSAESASLTEKLKSWFGV